MGETTSTITDHTRYNNLIKNKERLFKTQRGTYLIYDWNNKDTFYTYLIEYKKDGIIAETEPVFFNEKGDNIGDVMVVFKRDESDKNLVKVTRIKSSCLHIGWYPFVIKRIRENLNNRLKITVQKELKLVKKVAYNDSVQLTENDHFYTVPNNRLHSDKKWCIYGGEELKSENGIYTLCMQCDGNLVAYKQYTPYWASKTRNKEWTKSKDDKYSLRLHMNGQLVICYNNKVIWSPNKKEKHLANRPYILTLQNDGNLVLKNKNNKTIWSIYK